MKNLLSITAIFFMSLLFLTECYAADSIAKNGTKIILSIDGKTFPGVLNNNSTSKDLISKLPLTVSLNRYERDFCGGSISLKYDKKDLKSGYCNGELAYWPTGRNFVIFVEKEESSSSESATIIIGKLSSIKEIQDLKKGSIEVTVSLEK